MASASSKASAEQPATKAASKASAEQPANPYSHLPLALLNKASARTGGTWDVYVDRPFEDKYEYKWQGKARQGTNLIFNLVSAADPSQYCQAHFKKTAQNATAYATAVTASKKGERLALAH